MFIHPSIRTNFVRLDLPVLIDTSDLRQPKCFATSPRSSSFALPSTGGDLICASHVPSSCCSSRLVRKLGLTLTWMILDGMLSVAKYIIPVQNVDFACSRSTYY